MPNRVEERIGVVSVGLGLRRVSVKGSLFRDNEILLFPHRTLISSVFESGFITSKSV